MVEWPQTVGNTCEMTEALSMLLLNHRLLLYPDKTVRQHLLNARVKETQRGWRLIKGRQSKKIDLDIALAMAVLGAQQKFLLGSQRKGHVYTPDEDSPGEQLMKYKHDIAMGLVNEESECSLPINVV